MGLAAFGACCLCRVASATESNAAQDAYEQGVELFRSGNFEAACSRLAESYRLEPLPGVLFTWATCELRADRVASAAAHYAEFLEVVSRLPPAERLAQDERRQAAQRERARILPEVPYLTIAIAADELRTSAVQRDGQLLAPSALGVETPLDPGEHVIDFQGADGRRARQRVVLAKGEHKTIVVGFAGPRAAEASSKPPPPAPVLPPAAQEEHRITPWIYVSAGVGGAGLVTGALSGVMALRDRNIARDECEGPACTQRGKDAGDAAKLEATVSTIGFGVGLAGVVATAVLYLTDSSNAPRAAAPRWSVVAVSPNVIGVGGAF